MNKTRPRKHSARWYIAQIDIVQKQSDDWFALAELAERRGMDPMDCARLRENGREFDAEAERLREEALAVHDIEALI